MEMRNDSHKTPGHLYFVADILTLALEIMVYFVSFYGPAYILWHMKMAHPLILTILAILGWLLSALVFVLALIFLKRVVIGEVPTGRFFLSSKRAYRWIAADRIIKMMNRSPFRALVNDNAFYRYLYYRGMGAKISGSLLLGQRVVIPEPWCLKVGQNVLIGDEAIVSGHKVERNVVTLGRIEIGNDVLIGARALILPGVKIGDGAVVGAASVVTRGTNIPPGETWSGNPAKKLELFGTGAQPTE